MSYEELDFTDDFIIDNEFDIVLVPQLDQDDLRILCSAFKNPPTLIGLSMKNASLREQLGVDLSTFLRECDKYHNQYERYLNNWENWNSQFIAELKSRPRIY